MLKITAIICIFPRLPLSPYLLCELKMGQQLPGGFCSHLYLLESLLLSSLSCPLIFTFTQELQY